MGDPKAAVLIVDDEEKLCRFLRKEFERDGYAAHVAHEHDGALAVLARERVDVVLLDIALPGPSGVDILSELKAARPRLPVVMLTGNASVETAVKTMKLGAFDYLAKPYGLPELKALVDRAYAESCRQAAAEKRRKDTARRLEEAVRAAVSGDDAPSPSRSLAELEKAHILKVLAEQGGNRTQAARVLGVDVKTLYNKLKDYQAGP
ncbi:response regulator [bacterium]|nr:MAG: response regulator [bacterium]